MRKNKDLFSIFPADAGVNLFSLTGQECKLDIPRGCGGEPLRSVRPKNHSGYSPRMRG